MNRALFGTHSQQYLPQICAGADIPIRFQWQVFCQHIAGVFHHICVCQFWRIFHFGSAPFFDWLLQLNRIESGEPTRVFLNPLTTETNKFVQFD